MAGHCSSHTTQDAYIPSLASSVLLASTLEWWHTERDVTQLTVHSYRQIFLFTQVSAFQ